MVTCENSANRQQLHHWPARWQQLQHWPTHDDVMLTRHHWQKSLAQRPISRGLLPDQTQMNDKNTTQQKIIETTQDKNTKKKFLKRHRRSSGANVHSPPGRWHYWRHWHQQNKHTITERTGQSVDSWTERENWRHIGPSEAESNMSQKLTIHKKVHSLSRPHHCHYKEPQHLVHGTR